MVHVLKSRQSDSSYAQRASQMCRARLTRETGYK
jgi:hypothetical protein